MSAGPVPRRAATGRHRPRVVRLARVLGHALARALFRLRLEGLEHVPPAGPVLLAANHSAFLDGPLVFLLAPRPTVLLTKSEVFVHVGARTLGWLGLIPVHRGAADRAALRAGLEVLARGGALGVFPEGTRGTGDLATVNDGLAWLALRSGAPVVPVAVQGTAAALPRGSRVPRLRVPVRLVFGLPVTVATAGDPRARRTVSVAGEQLREALVAHLRAAGEERS